MQSTSSNKNNNTYFALYSFNNVGVCFFLVGSNSSCPFKKKRVYLHMRNSCEASQLLTSVYYLSSRNKKKVLK